MSTKMMPAAVVPVETVTAPMASAMPMAATVATAVTSSVAAAPGDGIARQRQHEGKNRNSQCAPEHGTPPCGHAAHNAA